MIEESYGALNTMKRLAIFWLVIDENQFISTQKMKKSIFYFFFLDKDVHIKNDKKQILQSLIFLTHTHAEIN